MRTIMHGLQPRPGSESRSIIPRSRLSSPSPGVSGLNNGLSLEENDRLFATVSGRGDLSAADWAEVSVRRIAVLKDRLLSIGMVLAMDFLLLVSLIVSAAL